MSLSVLSFSAQIRRRATHTTATVSLICSGPVGGSSHSGISWVGREGLRLSVCGWSQRSLCSARAAPLSRICPFMPPSLSLLSSSPYVRIYPLLFLPPLGRRNAVEVELYRCLEYIHSCLGGRDSEGEMEGEAVKRTEKRRGMPGSGFGFVSPLN